LEGAWTTEPAKWDNNYFENLFGYNWVLTKSPAGAHQWTPKEESAKDTVPDAHNPAKKHAPMMFTTDIALKEDPAYLPISKRFHENPDQFGDAFAKAWYKLTHRDMGPKSRFVGSLVPDETLIWQDPVPAVNYELIGEEEINALKITIRDSALSISQLVKTAWASASTFRVTDKRGGANGARIRLSPQKNWAVNQPAELSSVIQALEKIQSDFNNSQSGDMKVSVADIIILAGCTAIEDSAQNAGQKITVPFSPGRTDAVQEETDIESFSVLEPKVDGFRNYLQAKPVRSTEELLVDRAHMLSLTAPEMTVLIGGLRVLNTNSDNSDLGVFTDKPGTLTNDFFVNLLDMNLEWEKSSKCDHFFEGKDLVSKEVKWTGTSVDLLFGSNSQLRAISEVYGSNDSSQTFLNDFVSAWNKVMNLDRFDLED